MNQDDTYQRASAENWKAAREHIIWAKRQGHSPAQVIMSIGTNPRDGATWTDAWLAIARDHMRLMALRERLRG